MENRVCFAVDMGGTSIKMGIFHADGRILDKWEIPTRKENKGRYIIKDITEAIQEKKKSLSEEIIGLGIGVPGPVTKDGCVNGCINVGWGKIAIEQELSQNCHMPVKAGNDANVAALGELWQGGGKGFESIVLITIGTGIGGGIVLHGEVLKGEYGAAGEIGHMHVLGHETEPCTCGNTGCLEQVASATGIVRTAYRIRNQFMGNSILLGKDLTAKDILEAAKAGDCLGEMVMEQVAHYLGIALANVSCVVDPEAFVIGGGVSKGGTYLLNIIEREYVKYAFHVSKKKKFVLASLGNDAGIYGAARLILKEYEA